MNARRFCLSALFTLIAATAPVFAARAADPEESGLHPGFASPEATGYSFGQVVIGLGVGAALGWMLLSLCVAMHLREEKKVQKVSG